jgi:type IV pilus assembly protein PilV
MRLKSSHPPQARGTTLIEVLVALVLLSGAVLGMSILHANSVKYTKMAQLRGVATQLAFELADRMRANPQAAVNNRYEFTAAYDPEAGATAVPVCAVPAVCTSDEIAAIDLAEVRNTLRLALPGGGLRITRDAAANNSINIWIIWIDPEAFGNDANEVATAMPCPFASNPRPQCLAMRVAI